MKEIIKKCDGIIVYAEPMADYYELDSDKWILMEGVFDSEEYSENNVVFESNNKFSLMYSGAITKHRGIPELLDAFELFEDKRMELWFTGEGNCDELVNKYAEQDSRIKHYGFLDSREDVLAIQRKADVLIHTRRTDAASAAYCFPSKIFEYMVSGKPILSVRIPGIPNEYFKYMMPIEELSKEGIYNAINAVRNRSKEELKLVAEQARDYVLNEKNEKIQSKRILAFANIL